MTQLWASQSPKLLEPMRAVLRSQRYAVRTEMTYCDWVGQFVNGWRVRGGGKMVVTLALTPAHSPTGERIPQTKTRAVNP